MVEEENDEYEYFEEPEDPTSMKSYGKNEIKTEDKKEIIKQYIESEEIEEYKAKPMGMFSDDLDENKDLSKPETREENVKKEYEL